ncbi:MAG: endonuclease [Phycisphaerae bacterium]
MVRSSLLPAVVLVILLARPVFGQGISADTSVGMVTYSEFESLSFPEIWQHVNGLPFWAIPRDPPSDYYASANSSSAGTLRSTLHAIIDDHEIFKYTHPSRPGQSNHIVDTWDIVALADAHPTQPAHVLDIYLNNTFARQFKGGEADPHYDREHSWPKTLGFKKDSIRNAAYSDCHHLFAAYSSYNNSRGDNPYGTHEPVADRERTTLPNLGRGGDSDEPEDSNYSFSDVWQTWIGRRGDVARAMFYMDVRYEGGQRPDGNFEPDLQLTNTIGDIRTLYVWETGGTAFMGLKSALVDWHLQDPVDDLERRRNTVVSLFPGNSNPVLDHPEGVKVLFGDGTGLLTVAGAAAVWINEIHYDNAGNDTGEFVEIAGPAGLNLNNWALVGYNGTGGRSYRTVPLFGTIQVQQNGLGVLAFDFGGLQNGEADGVALVDNGGNLIQLISYEGHVTADDGAADGAVSTVIGVEETGATPVGHSLQLTGTGRRASDFQWIGPFAATRGQVNTGQEFGPAD